MEMDWLNQKEPIKKKLTKAHDYSQQNQRILIFNPRLINCHLPKIFPHPDKETSHKLLIQELKKFDCNIHCHLEEYARIQYSQVSICFRKDNRVTGNCSKRRKKKNKSTIKILFWERWKDKIKIIHMDLKVLSKPVRLHNKSQFRAEIKQMSQNQIFQILQDN